ncbi:MAG: putative DNA binding domain-containing protein [Ignavibacteriales bacterium]|nr:putative DNA binding domain-containing protein [Ignavibacteriales bacterium]
MKREQLIRDLIRQGESEQLELKAEVRNEVIAKTICGFLNGEGGQVVVGVTGEGKVVGVKNAERTESELQRYLIDTIVPEAPVTVSTEQVGDKDILLVKVWGGSRKPYVFGGSIFYRRGSQTVAATSREISDLIQTRQQTDALWERQPALRVEVDDLDLEEIRNTIRHINESGRGKTLSDDIPEFLSYHGLYQNGHVSNAAVVLFGKEPARFIPQICVRFSVFASGKTGSSFSEDRVLEGNLFKNIEEIQDLFKKHIAFRSKFDKTQWQRTDGFLYPMDALREGVLNALVHRDYSNVSGTASVFVFPDKIEISNYGRLPHEITIADLRRNHYSLPHNPDIAQMCFLKGYIEKIGRGTLKIIEACKSAGLKEPVWSTEASSIKLTFFSNVKIAPRSRQAEGGITGGVSKGVLASVEGVIEGVTEGVSEDVKDKIKEILLVVYKNEGLRIPEIAHKTETPIKSVERYVKQLRLAALIEFRGAPRTGGYFITKKAAAKISKSK